MSSFNSSFRHTHSANADAPASGYPAGRRLADGSPRLLGAACISGAIQWHCSPVQRACPAPALQPARGIPLGGCRAGGGFDGLDMRQQMHLRPRYKHLAWCRLLKQHRAYRASRSTEHVWVGLHRRLQCSAYKQPDPSTPQHHSAGCIRPNCVGHPFRAEAHHICFLMLSAGFKKLHNAASRHTHNAQNNATGRHQHRIDGHDHRAGPHTQRKHSRR